MLFAAGAIALLGGCGGGGDEGASAPDPNAPASTGRGSVKIEFPTEASSFDTESAFVDLSGSAFISPDTFVCCSGSASDTGVAVTWSSSTGASGGTTQSVEICSFFGFGRFLCDHTWSARIPLVVGANVIRVFATDFGRHSGTDGITVNRLPDRTPPAVSSTDPLHLATNVAVNRPVSATFSEAMDDGSLTASSFTVRDNLGNPVPGTVSVANRTASFRPASLLAGFTVHTATLSTGIRDAAGNALPVAHEWSFTTGSADVVRPAVDSVFPPAGSACMAVDAEVVAVFSEPVDPSTVSNLGVAPSFFLRHPNGSGVSAEVRVDGRVAVFDPGSLFSSITYTATLTTRIRDLAGNALPSNTAWTFTTQASGAGAGAWQPIAAGGSGVAGKHSAVWTGSEMIVFGPSDQGARYAPARDTWALLPVGPSGRQSHVAVWTGNEMIVWGGVGAAGPMNDGSRYSPSTDTWTPISTTGAPSARSDATAVWTGSEMIVWGGLGAGGLASDHGAYDPATDTWRPLSTSGAPNPNQRVRHTAVWTGSRMIVWGGDTNCSFGSCVAATGGMYDPVADAWQPVATNGAPSNRTAHTAVWTGTEMAVWGGSEINDFLARGLNTGALYDPAANAWREISMACGAAGRYGHLAVWTGSEMIVWGGFSMGAFTSRIARNTGARFDPAANSWQHMTTTDSPPSNGRQGVWTGSRMIVWSGSGAIYAP